jgi:two-component system, NarL family, nitrate/nitrite response regulator NarL
MGYTAVPSHIRRHQPARAVLNPRPKAIRIVIADGQPIFRQGLRRVIETQFDLRVVGEASDGAEAVKLVRKYAPDILLLDLTISGLAALKVLRCVQSSAPQVRGIVLAAEIETPDIHQALKFGVRGVMRKDSLPELLVKGIRSVMAGECWMGRENMANFLAWLGNGTSPSADVPTGNHLHLTSRELQIVSAIIEGETNKAIAERLGLSENTVKHHLTHIFDKLGVSSRLELAVFAQRALPSQQTAAQPPA